MEYPVHTIHSEAELANCPLFRIDHFQWNCLRRPQAVGRLAYLAGEGLLLHMECLETNPKRTYTDPQSPVCNDSAMEAFFAFTSETPSDDGMYLNFEINANGAMLAKYGEGRPNRQKLSPAQYDACKVRAEILADRWQIRLLLPNTLLHEICGIADLQARGQFHCNFYKISEDPSIEHYAAFSPLDSEKPNFHLPHCFAKAELV